ncbi:GGDEF domain-containing protein [Qipengyuania sp. 1NDW9]|uniref:sensor domain-containing diguanylate cyclase n=1 Tax=Qipengyuania xiapuensis TaxID=2867236 RepID=UPI001C87627B|nr:diguanylate cyclase [Qipengyuania xiapuensis]MBX7491952.1 GGDEF domain-containing protein [Qipengyuania xiapuensis]
MERFHPPIFQRVLRLVLLALLALQMAVPARVAAQEAQFSSGSVCHTSAKPGETYADLVADASRWKCDGTTFDWDLTRHVVRHDLTNRSDNAPAPRFAEFERNEYEKLTLIALEADGSQTSASYSFADTQLGSSSLKSITELPKTETPPVALVMVLEGGWWPEMLVKAKLVTQPSVEANAGYIHLLAALMCGLFLAPIIFDFGFYRALRRPFPLFHAVFCVMAAIQTAAVSGLIALLLPLSYQTELAVTYFSLDLMIVATFLFAYNFIEREFMQRRHKRILGTIAAVSFSSAVATTFFPDVFDVWIDHAYFGVLCSLLVGYFYVLFSVRAAGSRMAPYLILGFTPLAFIILIQATTVFVAAPGDVTAFTFDETWPQNFALLFEVVATALAVADRFISIRRERDRAVDAARAMEELSEHDELTGLLNRRALKSRFKELIAEGFTTMAIVDIDRFKAVNDIHGHPVGDEVLRQAGAALDSGADENLVAFRIGGEEFLLMLRGDEASKRAEARRRAISARTLSHVEGLEEPITASMGLLDFTAVSKEMEMRFGPLYSRADQLLYEAKNAGRNRTVEDTMAFFVPEAQNARNAAA